jgi:hypothetical protein
MAREDARLKFNETNPGAARSWDIYNRVVKPTLKREDDWKFVAIDILSEDFELDVNSLEANARLRLRRPNGDFWVERVGELTAYRHGWHGDDHESPP